MKDAIAAFFWVLTFGALVIVLKFVFGFTNDQIITAIALCAAVFVVVLL